MKFLYRLFCFSYRIQQWLLRRFTPGGLAILVCLVATAIISLDTKQTMAYQVLTFLLAILIIAIAFFGSSFAWLFYTFKVQQNSIDRPTGLANTCLEK